MLPTKSTMFGSRYLVDRLSEGDEVWHIVSPVLAVHRCRDCWSLAQGVPWVSKVLKGVEIFVTLFSYIDGQA